MDRPSSAPALLLPAPTSAEPADRVDCVHCGLAVPAGFVVAGAARQFCCAGCRTAFAILHEHGLDRYYDLPQRRDRPVRGTGHSYEQFDHPAFHALYVTEADEGRRRVELYLEGVHCASCVWLVERTPLVVPGVARAELNIRRALATIEWNPAAVPLSAIARTLDSLGYPPHPFRGIRRDEVRRREDRAALVGIGVAGALAINVMLAAVALYSGRLSDMEPVYERFFRWISLLLTVPALLGPGRTFFVGALGALRTRRLHMDLPIAVGLGAGFVRGAVNTITDAGPVYFDGLTTLVFVLLAGRYLQQRGQRWASDAAELLYSLTPRNAHVVGDGDDVREVPAEALVPGMTVLVNAGETVPADGEVSSGTSSIDRSLLTGESRPVRVEPGTSVFAGTLNASAPLRVRVTAAGESSRLARVLATVDAAAQRKAPVVLLADRLAGWFVGVVLLVAVLTCLAWAQRDPQRAIDHAFALLIVTCPCALAMATPLAVTVAVGRAARSGIYIRGGEAIELLARPGELLLDKTGTITEARTSLALWEGPDWTRPLVLALERGSSHPIADGFRRAWGTSAVDLPPVDQAEHTMGGGIAGQVAGRNVIVGSPSFVASRVRGVVPPAGRRATLTPVWVAVDGEIVARAGFGDPVRTDAIASVDRLRRAGWRVGILSGDASEVVRAVGAQLGIPGDRCRGDASPEEKLHVVERARAAGPVVMVGDGVNDAAAIAAASVGVGVHGGAEACLATADVYLTTPGLGPLVRLTEGAARTLRVIRRNIAFSLLYNLAGATLAVTGVITPLIAAILMPASSLTVVIASWYSRSFDADGART
jgi:Cu2+-exporting ATPase